MTTIEALQRFQMIAGWNRQIRVMSVGNDQNKMFFSRSRNLESISFFQFLIVLFSVWYAILLQVKLFLVVYKYR